MFIFCFNMMKKILYLFLSLFIFVGSISHVCLAQAAKPAGEWNWGWNWQNNEVEHTKWPAARKFVEHNPVRLLDAIYVDANGYKGDEVQNTQFDMVSYHWWCAPTQYTISNTLCSLKSLSKSYLQYLMYIWLTAATILIIRNWFMLVTSKDREKQFQTFKKNISYIVIWVILLVWFYYIIDFFVSIVNLIAKWD